MRLMRDVGCPTLLPKLTGSSRWSRGPLRYARDGIAARQHVPAEQQRVKWPKDPVLGAGLSSPLVRANCLEANDLSCRLMTRRS